MSGLWWLELSRIVRSGRRGLGVGARRSAVGYANAQVVVSRWSRYLADRPFRALVQMALMTQDTSSGDPVYWGGWAPLAVACGADVPPECVGPRPDGSSCRGCHGCQAARRVVSRATAALVAAQVVEVSARPRGGQQTEYRLLIHRAPARGVVPVVKPRPPVRTPVDKGVDNPVDKWSREGGNRVSRRTVAVVHVHDGGRRARGR